MIAQPAHVAHVVFLREQPWMQHNHPRARCLNMGWSYIGSGNSMRVTLRTFRKSNCTGRLSISRLRVTKLAHQHVEQIFEDHTGWVWSTDGTKRRRTFRLSLING